MSSSFDQRLRLAMKGPPRVSSVALARACRVKPPAVCAWLSGNVRAIKATHLIAASEFLRVRAKWLATGVGPMEPGGSDGGESLEELVSVMKNLTNEDRLTMLKVLKALQASLRDMTPVGHSREMK
jgi:hypothetical protein